MKNKKYPLRWKIKYKRAITESLHGAITFRINDPAHPLHNIRRDDWPDGEYHFSDRTVFAKINNEWFLLKTPLRPYPVERFYKKVTWELFEKLPMDTQFYNINPKYLNKHGVETYTANWFYWTFVSNTRQLKISHNPLNINMPPVVARYCALIYPSNPHLLFCDFINLFKK